MDNLVSETNTRLNEVINNLATIKKEYEKKLKANDKAINAELTKVKKYKKEFFDAKEKVEKMNDDIEGFSEDYKKLVERFKDDELANILVAANKEISLKIDERKRKIVKDKEHMNNLVEKAENVKEKLVVLTQEKNALEACYTKICDAEEYYRRSLNEIIDYSNEHEDNLCSYFEDVDDIINNSDTHEEIEEYETNDEIDENNGEEINEEEEIEEEITLDEINLDENNEFDNKINDLFNLSDNLEDDDSIYNKDEEN